ncbi:MAG: hypothetical protein A2087_10605 [Spirochaetes bacterium GWD1_61_31]|nr:MAG: hypothetical protein A2Y37_00135 [Spirochaetes bacterium GWB1_60_80]OHD32143.1 MAG: hypothetical protein A2004_05070 [Spirochaetes bacterium GWC1_61_12]OHD37122.1 MAG: hypothetical protein A2087_10605 [Spirochaetes bacterium GWD1_61_31]OHD42662.1 MAG: hypothetical protein A2Y35_12160 [Spirochaetes bacterium GWE1_60_18]OHD58543.1 MAG: hypothetical protein A2Y32_08740 [Spirochaetes bacterium GWF1_60_12]
MTILALATLVVVACSATSDRSDQPDPANNPASAPADSGAGLAGVWQGRLEVMGQSLNATLRFVSSPDGFQGTIDIPQQMAFDLALAAISLSEQTVSFTLPVSPPLQATGNLTGNQLNGRFSQGPYSGTFSLTRQSAADASATVVVPEPVGEAVSLELAGGVLHGSLLRPDQPATMGVLLIAGSGPTDRDGNSMLLPGRNDSLRQLAEALAANGFLVLRADKRGIGRSVWPGLREEDLTVDQYAADAAAWAAWLRQQEGIRHIGLAGHSEGALVAMLASQLGQVDALALLAPLSMGFLDTVLQQLSGAEPRLLDAVRRITAELQSGRNVADVPAELQSLFRPSVQPYLISLARHEPARLLGSLPVPVFIVAGGRDLQIRLDDVRALAAARPDATFRELADMNHVLKAVGPDQADNRAAYSSPDYRLADGLVAGLVDFFRALR